MFSKKNWDAYSYLAFLSKRNLEILTFCIQNFCWNQNGLQKEIWSGEA